MRVPFDDRPDFSHKKEHNTSIPHKSFYFVRHGESEANKLRIMCGGGYDTPLTEKGRLQTNEARRILGMLGDEKPRVLCHSDLSRAKETAQLLNKEIRLFSLSMPGLREHRMGKWEGLSWDEVVPMLEKKVDPENGERFIDFNRRIFSVTSDILTTHTLPLIVAHGGFWHALASIHGYEATEWPVNARLYFFRAVKNHEGFPWQICAYTLSAMKSVVQTDNSHVMVANRFSKNQKE